MKSKPIVFNHSITDGSIGFIYKATTPLGVYYGQKSYFRNNRVKIKGYKRKRLVVKESDWRVYRSSNKYIQKHAIKFEMIKEVNSKAELNIYEAWFILNHYVLSLDGILLNSWFNVKINIPKDETLKEFFIKEKGLVND